MSGHGSAPKVPDQRRNRSAPVRGEWRASPGIGWQHGPIPAVPQGLTDESRTAWDVWMHSWFASHWTPGDLPTLTVTVRLFDEVARGRYQRAGELRMWLDGAGVTFKGRQDRRWAPPVDEPAHEPAPAAATRYGHLRAVPAEKTREPKVVGESARRTADPNPALNGAAPGSFVNQSDLDAINARLREPTGDAS
jgi:hypothetical protein